MDRKAQKKKDREAAVREKVLRRRKGMRKAARKQYEEGLLSRRVTRLQNKIAGVTIRNAPPTPTECLRENEQTLDAIAVDLVPPDDRKLS